MKHNGRIKVLISAFACEPDEGSEPEVGWKWAQVMSRSCDVTVVTQTKNRSRIEQWYKANPQAPKISFQYMQLGGPWAAIKKKMPGGMYLYYAIWQLKLTSLVNHLLSECEIDLIHHVTFASFRMPVWIRGRPVIWGPVGGAETAMMPLLVGHGTFIGRMRERFRNIGTIIAGRFVSLWEPSHRSHGMALASTPATGRVFEENGIPYHTLPTIGFDSSNDLIEDHGIQYNEPLKLVFVGRLHLLKGLHLLIVALSKLRDQAVSLDIIGDGPERARLHKLVSQLKLDSLVTFHGHVPRTNLPKIFAEHDVVVAPSLYESGGLSVLEGFAQARPAIVLDCGGHALSVDEQCGIKIPIMPDQQGVIKSLATAIKAYQNDRALIVKHGKAAREKLKLFYSWEGKEKIMLKIYQDVLKASSIC
jgi:glycosyltransferase involved in cell wall biosynthesis